MGGLPYGKSLGERLLYTTVRIETESGSGTGFFFQFTVGGNSLPLIVTNKHVVKDCSTGKIVFHLRKEDSEEAQPSGESFAVTFNDFQKLWIDHPEESVDLCVTPLNSIANQIKTNQNKDLFTCLIREEDISSEEDLKKLMTMEEVTMAGYPIGLHDSTHNLPLLRRGVTATHPAVDFKGSSITVIDIGAFPGSSGSPVIILNETMYPVKGTGMSMGSRFIFLGVLYAGPTYNADGDITIKEVPTKKIPISKTSLMTHLGYIIKAKEFSPLKELLISKLKIPTS